MKDRLKRLRKNILKMNQTQFGKKIGIEAQAIAEIEKGRNELTERNFVRPKTTILSLQVFLKKLCQEHKVSKEIELVAAGIPRKNYKFVRQLKEIEKQKKNSLSA